MKDPRRNLLWGGVLSPPALQSHGDHVALHAGSASVTYGELADRVTVRGEELGSDPALVALLGSNDIEFVVTYLAAIDAHHPVIVLDGEIGLAAADAGFAPNVVVRSDERPVRIDRLNGESSELHPDLAVLLSTSGSTAASKMVRLSRDAVAHNAQAIAEYLELTIDDCGITALPLHYCYGLSVLTSHLAAGAALVLTDTAVVDPCFWDAVDRFGVTGVAGVPHTFELIDHVSGDPLSARSLRYVTQAGGRLEPKKVLALAEQGRRHDWELYVMYGQTEATARMAFLPPTEVVEHPRSVGLPVRGGSFRIDTSVVNSELADAGVGEIVYAGPNVMMGYATSRADLARGYDIDELRTGDLGTLDGDGRLEIHGRASRFLKIHGKRIDLDHLETVLSNDKRIVWCSGDDEQLVAVVEDDTVDGVVTDGVLASDAADCASLPAGRVRACRVEAIPRTASGKLDGPMLQTLALRCAGDSAHPLRAEKRGDEPTVADTFALVFDLDEVGPDGTFVSLGGDSFSYVEMSIRLEDVLGDLPAGWHLMSIAELESQRPDAKRRRRWTSKIETSVVIRAIAILLIVCTHMRVFRLAGGAHILLAVLGWNFARFQLLPHDIPNRLRRSVATVSRIAIPTSVWIGFNMLIAGGYSLGAMFLVNNYFGDPARRGGRWEYWYFETFVQVTIVLALVFSIGAVRRLERSGPFVFALGVLAVTWLFRFEIVELGHSYNEVFRPHTVASFIALGWCAQRSSVVWQKVVVTALILVTTFGYFATVGYANQFDRELRIALMITALVWIPSLQLPSLLALVVGRIAAASMYIFLIHWQVWPLFTPLMNDRVAFVLTIGVGVLVWWVIEQLTRAVARCRRQRRDDIGRSTSSQVSTAETAIKSNDATPVSA
ncbi:MAG: acyl-CoA synthetase (AMP-forming)/AMP-acid ligase II [Ilumatobacter sp.]